MVSTFYNSFIIIHLGDFNIPCPEDPFLEPKGENFVKKDHGNKGSKENKEETDEVETEERNEASKAIDLGGSKETSVKFKEDKTQIEIASNNIDPEFSNVQRNVAEVQTNPTNQNVKPPQLVALNSTDESLTWQLDGLDPKIRIDKYQVRNTG